MPGSFITTNASLSGREKQKAGWTTGPQSQMGLSLYPSAATSRAVIYSSGPQFPHLNRGITTVPIPISEGDSVDEMT